MGSKPKYHLARLALALVAAHVVLFLGLHLLEPQLSPASAIISDYAATDSTVIASVTFIVFAMLWLALAGALGPGHIALHIGRGLFVMASIFILAWIGWSGAASDLHSSLLLASSFPESTDPRTGTVLSRVQNLFARPGLFVGAVAVSLGAAKTPGWGSQAWPLVGLSISALVLLVFTVAVLLERGLGGVGQRLIFILLYSWAVLVSRHLSGVNQPARGSA